MILMVKPKPNRLKNDFRNFLYVTWKHLNLPEPTPIQYEIASWLQANGLDRKVLEAFRGVGKSWITSTYVCWKLYRDPELKFLVVSASKDRSDAFSTFTKRLIYEMDILNHLKPQGNQRDSMVSFDVGPAEPSHAPSVKSVGVFGQMTGARADEIIADDVEVPNNSYTQDMREKLFNRIMEFESIIKPDGKITFLGTPQTEESIYNKLRDRGFTTRIWTARYPSKELIPKYEGCLADTISDEVREKGEAIVGKPVDPQRFDEQDLLKRETSMGRSNFSLQFMLDTTLSDAEKYPLKLKDLIVFSTNSFEAPKNITWTNQKQYVHKDLPTLGFSGDRLYRPLRMDNEDWVQFEGSVMAIDPSGRGKDETSYVVIKQIYGYLYITKFGGLDGGYEENTLKKLAKIARNQKVNEVVIEDNFGDGMFTQMFKRVLFKIYQCGVEEVKHSKQKEKRIIDTLEPVMNSHRLVINFEEIKRDVEETYKDNKMSYSLLYQMTRLTKKRGALKHDDRIDVLSIGVAHWVEIMNRDTEQAIEDYKEEQMREELEEFMDHAVGNGSRSKRKQSDIREKILS